MTQTIAIPAAVPERSDSDRRDPYAPYRQVLLSPARVRRLSELEPWRVVAATARCWGLIIGAWALVAWQPTGWTVALAMLVVGSRYYALFILGHDGMHRRLFRTRWLNDLWNDVFCHGAIGAITRINNRNHLRHHQYLATELDPDRHKHACFNKADPGELIGYVTGIAGLMRTTRNVFRPRTGETAPADDEDRFAGYGLRDVAILAGVQGSILVGLWSTIGWWAYPVLWLLPVYAFAYLGDNLRSFAEHSHPERDDRADRHRLITYLSNPLERWFVAPLNMNYHAVHHLWPSIPYYNLPIADDDIRRRAEAVGLEWRRSYFGYLIRYWLALPLEECRATPPTSR
jgi:fatty acid desaturase